MGLYRFSLHTHTHTHRLNSCGASTMSALSASILYIGIPQFAHFSLILRKQRVCSLSITQKIERKTGIAGLPSPSHSWSPSLFLNSRRKNRKCASKTRFSPFRRYRRGQFKHNCDKNVLNLHHFAWLLSNNSVALSWHAIFAMLHTSPFISRGLCVPMFLCIYLFANFHSAPNGEHLVKCFSVLLSIAHVLSLSPSLCSHLHSSLLLRHRCKHTSSL